jgi:hypothetical protein
VARGSLTGDFQWYVQRSGAGELYVDMSRLQGLASGRGSLLEMTFKVAAGAQPGVVDLNLTWVSLNEGRLTLTPLPQPGQDDADGRVTVAAPAPAAAPARPGLLSALGSALRRVLGAEEALLEAQSMPSPLQAVAARAIASDDAVRALPQVSMGDAATAAATSVSTPSASRGWVKQFVATPPGKAPSANAGLRVTVPTSVSTAAHPVVREVN